MPNRSLFVPGVCIFCPPDSPQRGKTTEHVVPRGIGGTQDCKGNLLTLPRATCPDCQKLVHDFEDFCIRKTFRTFKVLTKTFSEPSKSGHANAVGLAYDPKYTPSIQFPFDKNHIGVIPLDSEDHPGTLALPVFREPGIFSGRRLTIGTTELLGVVWVPIIPYDETFARWAKIGKFVRSPTPFEPFKLARQLVKIAYCFALHTRGRDGFTIDPLVIPMLRGEDLEYQKIFGSWLVGTNQPLERPKTEQMHTCFTEELDIDGITYLSVGVHLFSRWGSPVYQVLIGTLPR
jgi:hypothetical protein